MKQSEHDGHWCLSCAAVEECVAVCTEGETLVTLDSASDGHCAPSDFARSCRRLPDRGPRLVDAQRKAIPFDSVAEVPMKVLGGQGSAKVVSKMR